MKTKNGKVTGMARKPVAGASAWLRCTEGTSDKVYNVAIVKIGDGWNIRFEYGRYGSTLKVGFKGNLPRSYEAAKESFDRLVAEKLSKGYAHDAPPCPSPTGGAASKGAAAKPKKPTLYVLTSSCDGYEYYFDQDLKELASWSSFDANWSDYFNCLVEHFGVKVVELDLCELLDEDALQDVEGRSEKEAAKMVAAALRKHLSK